MIRQAISCDICGAEMQHTNHWFVACSHGAELRVSGWIAGKRLRAGAKHLCGQTCLHKLVDEFLARTVPVSAQPASKEDSASAAFSARKPLSSPTTFTAPSRANIESTQQPNFYIDAFESSARLIPTPEPLVPSSDAALPEAPAFATPNWRAEAWKRERERTLRGDTHSALLNPHRRNIA